MDDKELEAKVSACTDIHTLVKLLSDTPVIQGSHKEYTGESMARRAMAVYKGYDLPRYVTRAYGIRRKIMELNRTPQEVIDFYCKLDQ